MRVYGFSEVAAGLAGFNIMDHFYRCFCYMFGIRLHQLLPFLLHDY